MRQRQTSLSQNQLNRVNRLLRLVLILEKKRMSAAIKMIYQATSHMDLQAVKHIQTKTLPFLQIKSKQSNSKSNSLMTT